MGSRYRRAALAGTVALAARALARRARHVRAVPPALRTPDLWLPLSIGSGAELRIGRRLFPRPTEPVAGVEVTRHDVPGGQDVFVYEPAGRARPTGALLWVHGGGTVIGRPEGDHDLCSRMARDLGIVVVSARYRLAPEHPFPAALDDLTAALRRLRDEAGALGVDPARIAVGGASAGGGLAAAVVQRAHDEGVPVAFQLLVYPMLDDRTVLRRSPAGRGHLVWTPRSNAYAWTAYLGHPPRADELRPYAAPARRLDLAGLPPAWIGVGDLDLFHDEDVAYARRLEAAGVPVELHVERGMYHAAELELQATVAPMRAFQQRVFDALAAGLATTRPA
ncbi:acetyl esterase/lipase [Geodermatophilus bullaregiensis]|uniref:alpha/beta hydrolase n=1 Tax=Geodermatophilus bullaregiensis TaxID=1564160 RepID=UPI001956D807|nr:alpha/beta hydrolase [Geodermatophilus bullaregiensis]MBM7808930.1 acetyl esterase/lipase [Geodermatophilus bullaregiensis]